MYDADECFKKNIDKYGEGSAEFALMRLPLTSRKNESIS